jgi:chemotaxis protein CheD
VRSVGIGEIVVSTDPAETIQMIGLGSCVGVFLTVPGKAVAAAHVLLPSSAGAASGPPGKFADTAVPELVRLLGEAGLSKGRATATLVGGGQVLSFGSNRPEFDIGRRNADAVRAALQKAGVRVAKDETGGTKARSARMVVAQGAIAA